MRQRTIILNLVSVLVVAFGLTTFLHELAHASAAKLLGVDSTLFHTSVSFNNRTIPASHELFILASGPLFSFFQAILCLILFRKKQSMDYAGLLYLWMGVIGMVVFLGYLMMGPFIAYGDTGKIYAILETPIYVSHAIAALALIGIIIFFRKLTPPLLSILSDLKSQSAYDKSKSFSMFFVLPLLASTLLNTLISLPAPTLMSLAFPLLLPLTMLPTAIKIGKSNWPSFNKSSLESSFSSNTYWPILSMLLVIIVSRILTTGIQL